MIVIFWNRTAQIMKFDAQSSKFKVWIATVISENQPLRLAGGNPASVRQPREHLDALPN